MKRKNHVLENQLNEIKQQIQDPKTGLPEELFEFVTTLTPMVNVDLLVKDDSGRVLLAWRDDDCGKGWHIPGGIIRYKERAEDRIQRTAVKELGTKVIIKKGPVEIHEIFTPQEIRGHFISFLYECSLPEGFLIPAKLLWEERTAVKGSLKWHDRKPELVRGQADIYSHIF